MICLFIVTRWWTLFLGVPNGPFAGFHAGMVMVGYGQPNGWPNGVSPWVHHVWNWLPRGGTPGGKVRFFAFLPLWMLAVPMGALTVLKWWRDLRIPITACRACGYDLTGTASGICPECGKPAPASASGTPAVSNH